MENLFYQLVLKLSELGEAEFKNVFVDGTKIEANAKNYMKKIIKTFNPKLHPEYDYVDIKLYLDKLKEEKIY